MERYVKVFINRSKKNLTKDFLEKNLSGRRRGSSFAMDLHNNEAGNKEDALDSQSGTLSASLRTGIDLSNVSAEEKTKYKTADSIAFEGTGRYQNVEELHSCIATEKGLLEREDFEHIQKVIEVYSKALLCDLRQKHR